MAVTKTWECDRCGRTGTGNPMLELTVYISGREDLALCESCVLALVAWAKAGV